MISLKNINKYYFKGEGREIHVVNNVTLEFPDAGFVTILGASGSGKTTLLNIIGGLDKYDSGTITYNDTTFDGYNMDTIDKYRREKMGYIFQNYLLINNLSVYNNLKLALELINVTSPAEQKKRIEYALRCVGLYKYRKKKVRNLSGGQMQRVSIARCLVKDADIIIADEPTGNVDSENTIQIMNILKHISKTKLVILVTHEIPMASYYSDRIIQVKDGQIISDGIVTNNGSLNTQTDRKIYLGDLNKEEASSKKLNFELFVDEESTTSDVVIVVRNDTVYVKSNKKVVNLNESSIELVNDTYHDVVDSLENFEYDTSWYEKPVDIKKQHPFFTNFFNGFKEFATQGKIKILFIVIYIILGILFGTVFIDIGSYFTIDYSNIIDDDYSYVIVTEDTDYVDNTPVNQSEVYKYAFDNNLIKDIYPVRQNSQTLTFKENYIFYESHSINFYLLPFTSNIDINLGNRPYLNECVIGKKLADTLIEIYQLKANEYDKLLGRELSLYPTSYTISGIASNKTNSIYVNNIDLSELKAYNVTRYNQYVFGCVNYYKNSISLINGILPEEAKEEILVDETIAADENLIIGSKLIIDGKEYSVSGLFKENGVQDVPGFLLPNNNYAGYAYNIDLGTTTKDNNAYSLIYLPSYEYELVEGNNIAKAGECLANINSGLEIGNTVYGVTIVGLYKKSETSGSFDNSVKYDSVVISSQEVFNNNLFGYSYTLDEKAWSYLAEQGYEVLSIRDYQIKAQKEINAQNNIGTLVFAVIVFIATILLTYLSNRGKIINEIGTIGVYRSIGNSRKALIYQKMGYNFMMTTVSALIGYAVSWTIYYIFNSLLGSFLNSVAVSPLVLIIGVICIYLCNIFIGILPIVSLVRKTPAEINSKYDI